MAEFRQIAKDLYFLATPFGRVTTGIALVLGDEPVLIDSGADSPEKYLIPALDMLGLRLNDIAWLTETHAHGDHITGHAELKGRYGLRVAAAESGVAHLTNPSANAIRIRSRFPEHSPAPQSWLRGVTPDLVLPDGGCLAGRLRLIETPGHDSDCVAFLDELTGVLITGDSVQANGTETQGIALYMDLPAYLTSLDRLSEVGAEILLPGHDYDGIGACVIGEKQVNAALAFSREMTCRYEREIAALLSSGVSDSAEIACRVIDKLGCGKPEHLFLSLYTVCEHMKKLQK